MAGRKKLPPELKRQKLCIALTPHEIYQLQEMAEKAKLTTSQILGVLINQKYESYIINGKPLTPEPDATQNDI